MKQTAFPALSVLALLTLLWLAPALVTAMPAQITPLPPVAHPDGLAGTCYSHYPGDPDRPYLPLVYDAGARWNRYDFSWPAIETSDDVWNWSGYDTLVNDMVAADTGSIAILLWTPDWAAESLAAPQPEQVLPLPYAHPSPHAAPNSTNVPPRGLCLPWYYHDNLWGDFVYNTVSRYQDRIKYWEVWNEEDWGYFWAGSEQDYARLLTVAYQAIKEACPDCTVLYGGLMFWSDQTHFERVLDIINDESAAAHNYYFDVMSMHLYSRSSDAYDIVNYVRSRMSLYVPAHPIWITEIGVPVWDDDAVDPNPAWYPLAATQEEAAAFLIQSYANGRAASIERYIFFRANDQSMSEFFGLIRDDLSLRPSYVAYQVATSYLVSPTMTTS